MNVCIAGLFSVTGAALALFAPLVVAAESAGPPVSIVLITADNLGYGDLASYGNPDVRTPHLDRFAAEGVRCTAFYSASPSCAPSRAALLTGRYPQRNGLNVQSMGGPRGEGLRSSEKLVPAYLKSAGYATGCFGKWNIGFLPGKRPTERGFDEYIGNAGGFIDYYNYNYRGRHDLYRGTEPYASNRYSTDLYADSAIDFIRRHSGSPFFVYLPFNAPHFPGQSDLPPEEVGVWKAPDEAFALYGLSPREKDPRRRYHAVISALDAAIGRVLGELERLRLVERTLVIFYSDNGALMRAGEGLEVASNAPLREGPNTGGTTLWEGGIRVPAILRWPGRLPAGTVCSEPVISLDLLPMFLAATGVSPPADRVLDGIDPTAILAGRSFGNERAFFWQYTGFGVPQSAARIGQYKLFQKGADLPFELFDLINDPQETRDLAADKPHLVAQFRAQFAQWLERTAE